MIDSMTLYNYSLPGESLPVNEDIYPVHSFSTEVDVRSADQVKPTEHGIWNHNTFYGKRLWHLEGDIMGDSSASYIQARRRLLRMLTPKSHLKPHKPLGYLEVQFTGMAELLTSEFTIDSYPEIPIEGLSPARTAFQLNLRSPDPRLYGKPNAVDAFPTLTIVGRSYNKTYDKTYAATTAQGDTILTNSGDIETPISMLIRGPVTSPYAIRVDPDGTLHTFKLDNLVLSSTDIVVIDFKSRTAVNTTTGENVYKYTSGEWWKLEPGNNTVRIGAFSQIFGSYSTFNWQNGYMI